MKPLLLTFDLEEFDLGVEWGRPLAIADQIDVTARGLTRLVPLLEAHRVCATFFTTAVFAQARGDLLRGLADAGHEVAVHGLAHQDDYGQMDAVTAVKRLEQARAIVELAAGGRAAGIRTPHLRPCPADRLRAAGFDYDASPHPTWVPTRYNGLRLPRRPWRDSGLLRVPISVLPGCRVPVSFVWYRAVGKRLRPLALAAASRGAPYLHLYFHPWEAEDIRRYGAPAWLAVGTGAAFVTALEALLNWAAPRLRAETVGSFSVAYNRDRGSPAAA
ncbi:MAG: polysaccharide deacetylase family protein [bacterium]